MPLTTSQRSAVRFYLGYPIRYLDLQQGMENALNVLEGDADATTRVIAIIAALDAIATGITAAYARLAVTTVCKTTINARSEICTLRSEGKRMVNQLSSILEIEVYRDVFSSSPNMNENFWAWA